MNTKVLLIASAIVMGLAGIAGSFLPHEIAGALALSTSGLTPVLLQLLAGLLFAFAMVNWMARGSLIGGIYNRPVAVGNVTHFLIGGLALGKAVAAGADHPAVLTATAVYALFAAAFALLLFRSPVQRLD